MTGFITRWLLAFMLLAATFNPTEFNYLNRVQDFGRMNLSVAMLFGFLLAVGDVIYLRATRRSIWQYRHVAGACTCRSGSVGPLRTRRIASGHCKFQRLGRTRSPQRRSGHRSELEPSAQGAVRPIRCRRSRHTATGKSRVSLGGNRYGVAGGASWRQPSALPPPFNRTGAPCGVDRYACSHATRHFSISDAAASPVSHR